MEVPEGTVIGQPSMVSVTASPAVAMQNRPLLLGSRLAYVTGRVGRFLTSVRGRSVAVFGRRRRAGADVFAFVEDEPEDVAKPDEGNEDDRDDDDDEDEAGVGDRGFGGRGSAGTDGLAEGRDGRSARCQSHIGQEQS